MFKPEYVLYILLFLLLSIPVIAILKWAFRHPTNSSSKYPALRLPVERGKDDTWRGYAEYLRDNKKYYDSEEDKFVGKKRWVKIAEGYCGKLNYLAFDMEYYREREAARYATPARYDNLTVRLIIALDEKGNVWELYRDNDADDPNYGFCHYVESSIRTDDDGRVVFIREKRCSEGCEDHEELLEKTVLPIPVIRA